MKRQDVEDIVAQYLEEHESRSEIRGHTDKPEMLASVEPFKAFNASRNPIEVIGVGYFNNMLQFLVIEEAEGEIFPIFREHVFKDLASVNDSILADTL